MVTRYYLNLPNLGAIAGAGPFAFRGRSADVIAEELQNALRSDDLFQRWRAAQEDPDAVDPTFGVIDSNAVVEGAQADLHIELIAVTSISSAVLRHRLRLLAGHAWQLRDVTAA